MDPKLAKGEAALILCGRGAGRVCAVVGEAEGKLLVADGRRIRISSPKAKNPKHLQAMGNIAGYVAREREFGISDPYLKKALRPFENKNPEEGTCPKTT